MPEHKAQKKRGRTLDISMAPVYNFRHVEIDNIGRGKRIVTPPSGRNSGIFDSTDSPQEDTPRKVKNYSQSNIFSPITNGHTPLEHRKSKNYMESRIFGENNGYDTPKREHGSRTPSACSTDSCNSSKYSNTQYRLFGPPEGSTPRKTVDRMKSSIFEPSEQNHSPSPRNYVRRNPITGDI
ncbi:microtubule-associated protein Jupiter-like isoform X2 [Centruroides sculpturatus]|uniref:microtubule-associated protein Jupiter-like isoform X2 n=1 Tax=Centruroides sculpturatus TaxID=218467 RepID=UPI000C6E858A|nr:microtubule-associated protein Jupiter-like isoform X2 [Centruroides sculpturatus]